MTPHTFSESLSQSFAIILYFSPSISLQKVFMKIIRFLGFAVSGDF